MKKRHFIIAGVMVAISSIFIPTELEASDLYGNVADYGISPLNNDANFPFVYVYHAQREYIDLSSIVMTKQDGNYSEFAVCYIITNGYEESNPIKRQGVWKFRYIAGGSYRPQYYDEQRNEWRSFPRYEYSVVNYIPYASYIGDYNPYGYYAFKIVYQKLFNKEFPDGMQGKVI